MFWGRNLSIRWLRVQGLFKLYLYGVRGWVRKAGDFCCPLLLHHQSLLPCVDVSVLERHRTTSAVNTPLFNARHGLQCASVPAVMCRKKKTLAHLNGNQRVIFRKEKETARWGEPVKATCLPKATSILPIPLLRFNLSLGDEVLESLLMPLCCPCVVLLLFQSQSFPIRLLYTSTHVSNTLNC